MKSYVKSSARGNAVVEYILITALTAIATIAIFRAFRSDVSQAYKKAGEAMIQGVEEGVSNGQLSNGSPQQ